MNLAQPCVFFIHPFHFVGLIMPTWIRYTLLAIIGYLIWLAVGMLIWTVLVGIRDDDDDK